MVLHRPVEAARPIGMWEPQRLEGLVLRFWKCLQIRRTVRSRVSLIDYLDRGIGQSRPRTSQAQLSTFGTHDYDPILQVDRPFFSCILGPRLLRRSSPV